MGPLSLMLLVGYSWIRCFSALDGINLYGVARSGQQAAGAPLVQTFVTSTSGLYSLATSKIFPAIRAVRSGDYKINDCNARPTPHLIAYLVAKGGNTEFATRADDCSIGLTVVVRPCHAVASTTSIWTTATALAPALIPRTQSATRAATRVVDRTTTARTGVPLASLVGTTVFPSCTIVDPFPMRTFGAMPANSANCPNVWELKPAVSSVSFAESDASAFLLLRAYPRSVVAAGIPNSTEFPVPTVVHIAEKPANLFGLTVLNFTTLAPSIQYGTTRTWDAYPDLDWSDANPSAGVFNFKSLDQFIAANQIRGSDIIYTFGRTPRWASSQPNATTSYGPGQCAPPMDISAWDSYVSAITNHAAGRIKYWELWNEPNSANYYCGDMVTLVTMAQHAARIIKSIDPTALILSPSATGGSGPPWLAAFLSSGGAAYLDVIAFHGYWSAEAEDVVSVISNFRSAAGQNGAAGKPLWDTESSWAGFGTLVATPSSEHQAAFIAKAYLLHWSQGVARLVWYAYDGGTWGGFLTPAGIESAAATSYKQIEQWIAGATLAAPCSQAANEVWTCRIVRSGGYEAEAVWISNSTANFTVLPQYVEYRDLTGMVHPISTAAIQIGDEPILLETGPRR